MIVVGLKYKSEVRVDVHNTAATLGSGDMDVFATPAMVALMENAAMKTVAQELTDGSSTVGALINVSHLKPSGIGATITAEAELVAIDGRKLTFKVTASDETGIIGEGTHIRYVVDREKFLSKI